VISEGDSMALYNEVDRRFEKRERESGFGVV
jgi:hypothetical protein